MYQKFLLRNSCLTSKNLSKEQTSEKTLTDSEERLESCGELLRWSRRFSTLFEPAQRISETQRIARRKASADAEDQNGDVFTAVGRELARDTCCEREHGERIIDRELNKYRQVLMMKFRRDIIFDDRILVALCVGTAILGLVALILVE